MEAIRPNQDTSSAPPQVSSGTTNPDLIKILIRWKWLPILGSLVGATAGFLYFGQLPQQYKALALVQVVSPAREVQISNTFNQQALENRGVGSDELVVVQSPAVLSKAVDIGRLTQHRKLAGKSSEQIVRMLQSPKLLELRLGSKDVNSNIIQIGVTTDDAELSGDILQAVVSGYEDFVTGNIKNYTKEALAALTKFGDEYEKNRTQARADITKISANPNLIMKEGKPHDPDVDTVLGLNEKLRALDSQSRNIEAVLKQVEEGRSAQRSPEQLLKLLSTYTTNLDFRDDVNSNAQRSDFRAQLTLVEAFEQDRVIPLRSALSLLLDQAKGESHPEVIAVKNRLSKVEEELTRRRERLKEYESESSTQQVDIPTMESRLNVSVGALKEALMAISFEKNDCKQEIESLRGRMQENQASISKYALSVAELEAVSEVATQISENLRKLSLGSEYGQKTVTRLALPQMGSFNGPYWAKYIGGGAALGFIAFAGLAYLLEMADRSYRNPEEIATDLGMPIIGHLPLATISRVDRIDDKVDSSVVTLHKARSPISEAFRGIRTGLFFGCQQGGVKVIQVTSPIPGDGKSTVAANIAVSIALSGRNVCLVDCDFRRPRVAKLFGLREDIGFVQVIGGKAELDDSIQATSVSNLSALTCGKRPSNPAELLSSEVFGDLIATLRERFDFVIVDTPPMLAVSDPANVARHVDGILLTIRLRRNLRPIASRAAQMLHALNANMLGVVVNGIGVGGNAYGYGGYRYDNYGGANGRGYGKSGYGGYGYGSTYQYGGYYGGTAVGKDYYDDSAPKIAKRPDQLESKT